MDNLSKKKRSWNMSRIRSKNTKPELLVRSLLHRLGYRFRVHVNKLPGKPDIVLKKHKTVIFVHGCFWHRHAGCKDAAKPKSNTEFWMEKLRQNVKRDRRVIRELESLGLRVHIIWECETCNADGLRKRLLSILH
jgi:DNA mismatch endonuclease, patch repair protein